jgi:hypothetical protein
MRELRWNVEGIPKATSKSTIKETAEYGANHNTEETGDRTRKQTRRKVKCKQVSRRRSVWWRTKVPQASCGISVGCGFEDRRSKVGWLRGQQSDEHADITSWVQLTDLLPRLLPFPISFHTEVHHLICFCDADLALSFRDITLISDAITYFGPDLLEPSQLLYGGVKFVAWQCDRPEHSNSDATSYFEKDTIVFWDRGQSQYR